MSCTKNAGKTWIRQSFFANVSKVTISPKVFYRQSFLLYGIMLQIQSHIAANFYPFTVAQWIGNQSLLDISDAKAGKLLIQVVNL